MDARPLKGALRVATITCLVLSIVSGVYAATQAMTLVSIDEVDWVHHPPSPVLGDPALAMKIIQAEAAALEQMRVGRSFTLTGLAIACALVSVSAARMLRPRGLPRAAVARILSGSALAAALLRTLDGAEAAVVARRVGLELAAALPPLPELQDPEVAQRVKAITPGLLVGFTALHTALIAGLFLVLAQYFRSARAQRQIEEIERP